MCYLNLIANCSYVDGFRIELINIEVQFDSVVVRPVDATLDGIAVHLHQELLQSTRSARRRRTIDCRRLDCGTRRHQAENIAVYVGHLVSESQLQPFHLLADVSDPEVDRETVRVGETTRLDADHFR